MDFVSSATRGLWSSCATLVSWSSIEARSGCRLAEYSAREVTLSGELKTVESSKTSRRKDVGCYCVIRYR